MVRLNDLHSDEASSAAGRLLHVLADDPSALEPLGTADTEDWASLGNPDLRNTIRQICLKAGWARPQDGTGRLVAVTSALEGEGSSFLTTAIAISTALDTGGKVLLVDCNLLQPTLDADFSLADGPGLSDIVAANSALVDVAPVAIQPTGLPNLWLLPAGERAVNPAQLFRSRRMADLLRHLAGEYAFVALDLPPVLAHGEAATLARLVDGVLLVVRAGRTEQRSVQQALWLLSGATIQGVVLNRQRSSVPRLLRKLLAL